MILTFELPKPPRIPSCGACHCPMHLAKIDWETERVDRYTFDCRSCDAVETQSIVTQ